MKFLTKCPVFSWGGGWRGINPGQSILLSSFPGYEGVLGALLGFYSRLGFRCFYFTLHKNVACNPLVKNYFPNTFYVFSEPKYRCNCIR